VESTAARPLEPVETAAAILARLAVRERIAGEQGIRVEVAAARSGAPPFELALAVLVDRARELEHLERSFEQARAERRSEYLRWVLPSLADAWTEIEPRR
jgi:hypothetical protein